MTRDEFTALLRGEMEALLELNNTKGREYAGDADALANFKGEAAELGLTAEQVWHVFANKHWRAISAYCRTGEVLSEDIDGRIRDLALYGFLLLGLARERQLRTRLEAA